MSTILWLRNDLRTADHPALRAALDRGEPVIPLYIYSPDEEAPWTPGGASKVWLHHSLAALDNDLRSKGSQLIVRQGPALEVLQSVIKESGADAVYWSRRYEPQIIARDTEVKTALKTADIEVKSFNASLLNEPWEIKNGSGKPYLVFTPYYRYAVDLDPPRDPLPAPRKIAAPKKWPKSETLQLLPAIPWDEGIHADWPIGEAGARASLKTLLGPRLDQYSDGRDQPGVAGTSRLSPHLHFGEISPHTIWHEIQAHAEAEDHADTFNAAADYIREIYWREYAYHLLYHFPHTTTQPLKEAYADFPWDEQPGHLAAWQKGQTGYPMVDAGMRELWHTGWMHNRVRMITASFLIKHLLIPWQKGAEWFWDTLVDADLASNSMGWQWTAGSGADASPFFRIFNPITQGSKFDGKGAYVRKWCPELANMPDKWIYDPSNAPAEILQQAGVTLGVTYPHPIVEHKAAREKALRALDAIKMK